MDDPNLLDSPQRLKALRDYHVLDTPTEADYDDITELACTICDTPISLISLIDESRQWFKSCIGLDVDETPRSWAFCAHAIQAPHPLFVVPDALADPRFVDNPLVTGAPFLRFYAGIPLITPEGHALGTLCVIDRVPRTLTAHQERSLAALARQVVARLELQRQIRLRAESEARFLSAIEAMQEGLVLQEKTGAIALCNPQAEQILGLTVDQMLGLTSLDPRWRAIHADGSPFPGETHPAMRVLQSGQPQKNVVMGVHKPSGALTWISINASPLFHPSEREAYAVVATFTDITERKRVEEERIALLEKLATTDGLTGLNNHRKFQEDLRVHYHLSVRHQHPLSLLLLDVDHFKDYNDGFGHPAGDALLKSLADLLMESKRLSDLVARYGGEELAVVLPETDAEGARIVAERLRRAVEGISGHQSCVTVSIGIASLTATTASQKALIEEADQALYASKRLGRNRVTHYSELGTL